MKRNIFFHLPSSFTIQRSSLNVNHSSLNVHRQTFIVNRSSFNAQRSYIRKTKKGSFLLPFCRGDRTRTCDSLVPNQERYQLRYTSVALTQKLFLLFCGCKGTNFFWFLQIFSQLFYNILFNKYFFQYHNASFHLFFGMI